jgi:hypothetical protein
LRGYNGGSTQNAIVNICCEERVDDMHDCGVKKFMSLENFGVMVTNIDRQKFEEERLSLKMMEKDTRLLCRIRTMLTRFLKFVR